MPTTRSGGQYGPGVSPGPSKNAGTSKKALLSKRKLTKAAAKTYAKAKPQHSKKELTTKVKDAGKKKAVQSYKKPPIKASATKAQKISKIQAAKRKEIVDKKRFRRPRIQSDGDDYPDIGMSELIDEDKPGYIFMRQQVDPENDNQPVDIYRVEVIGQDAELPPPSMVESGASAFRLKLMPNTYFSVTSMSEARNAVCRVLGDFSSQRLREGWFTASEEELDEFIERYSATLA